MAASTKALKIGVIAEEHNDVDVVYELTCKLINEREFSMCRFVGHGCGKVRRKCEVWARALLRRGCTCLIVMHDLDRRNEEELRRLLEECIDKLKYRAKLVIIPVEEVEAWLLSDAQALMDVFNMQCVPKLPKHPETVGSPKELLANIINKNSNTQYLNTVHNRRIAKAISIADLSKCRSFTPFPNFVKSIFPRR